MEAAELLDGNSSFGSDEEQGEDELEERSDLEEEKETMKEDGLATNAKPSSNLSSSSSSSSSSPSEKSQDENGITFQNPSIHFVDENKIHGSKEMSSELSRSGGKGEGSRNIRKVKKQRSRSFL